MFHNVLLILFLSGIIICLQLDFFNMEPKLSMKKRGRCGIIATAIIPPEAKRSGIGNHSLSWSDYGITATAMIRAGVRMDCHTIVRGIWYDVKKYPI